MELDYLHLLFVLLPVIILYRLLLFKIYDKLEKVYVSIIFWGLYFYGGIGASSYEVGVDYTYYFLFFMAAFVFFYRLRYNLPSMIRNSVTSFFVSKERSLFVNSLYSDIAIGAYIFVCFLFLLYPEFKLDNLIHPPVPNAFEALLDSVDTQTKEVDIISKLLFYIKLLISPLYFVALIRYTKKPLVLFLLLFVPLYFDYCSSDYIGRGMILMALMLFFFTVYMYNKKLRKPLLFGSIILLPILLYAFYTYSIVRMGGDTDLNTGSNIIEELFYQEVNFPESFSTVVSSGKHIDFPGFIEWVVTLPFPKFMLGGVIQFPVINFDLAEIVTGFSRSDTGFWVKLTGYVTESYYIFGKNFFWIGALMVAFIAKTLFYLLRAIKGTEVFIIYTAIQFGFMYSRAGLGAILPTFANGFLMLYAIIFLKIYMHRIYEAKTLNANGLT